VQEATVDYNASDFEAALAKLTEAYKLKSDAALLFDIAQCYRALHQWERAEFTYKAYLKERPEAHDRKKVKALIAKVHVEREQAAAAEAAKQKAAEAARQKEEADKAQAEVAPPPVAAPVPPAPVAAPAEPAPAAATSATPSVMAEAETHRRIPVVTWVLGGVGAAALLGGGYFGFADAQIAGQNHPTTGSDGLPLNTITYAQFQQSQNDAAVADTLFIAGGVLVAVAVIWAFAAPAHRDSKSPPPTPNGVPF
jgi:tetratricopeptide (TPR) repeat protein